MAQPFKQGLDFFNIDVDIDEDEKIVALDKKFPETYKFIIFMWKFIYKHSYYVHWTELEIGKFQTKTRFSREFIDDIVKYCIEIEIFDGKLYEKYGILTSQSIQTRWLVNSKRRKIIGLQQHFTLIDPNLLKKLNWKNISINKNIDSKFKAPVKVFKLPDTETKKPTKHIPQVESIPKKTYGTYTHEEVLDFIKIPYDDRNIDFKKLHNESWYNSYVSFNNLIDEKFQNLRVSSFQITLIEYKEIMNEHRALINQKRVLEVLTKMSSSGTTPGSKMSMRFVQFLLPQNNSNQNGQTKTTDLPAHVNFTKARVQQ